MSSPAAVFITPFFANRHSRKDKIFSKVSKSLYVRHVQISRAVQQRYRFHCGIRGILTVPLKHKLATSSLRKRSLKHYCAYSSSFSWWYFVHLYDFRNHMHTFCSLTFGLKKGFFFFFKWMRSIFILNF